jgi:hypothetical protein
MEEKILNRKFEKYYFKARLEYQSDTPVEFETNDLERDLDKLINWINLHIGNSKNPKYSIGDFIEVIVGFVDEYKKTDDFKDEIKKVQKELLREVESLMYQNKMSYGIYELTKNDIKFLKQKYQFNNK